MVIVFAVAAYFAYKYYREYQKNKMRENVRDILATYIPLNDFDSDSMHNSGDSLNQRLTEI